MARLAPALLFVSLLLLAGCASTTTSPRSSVQADHSLWQSDPLTACKEMVDSMRGASTPPHSIAALGQGTHVTVGTSNDAYVFQLRSDAHVSLNVTATPADGNEYSVLVALENAVPAAAGRHDIPSVVVEHTEDTTCHYVLIESGVDGTTYTVTPTATPVRVLKEGANAGFQLAPGRVELGEFTAIRAGTLHLHPTLDPGALPMYSSFVLKHFDGKSADRVGGQEGADAAAKLQPGTYLIYFELPQDSRLTDFYDVTLSYSVYP